VLKLLDFTVAKLRVQLEVERVILYTLGDQSVVESVAPGYPSVLELCLADPGLEEDYKTVYQQGQIVAIEDIEQTELSEVAIAQLTPLKAKAVLIVPLISHGQRLGGLCVHQCITPRHWDQPTIERLTNLSNLLAIALFMNTN
jgi:GAF domain-containing protein